MRAGRTAWRPLPVIAACGLLCAVTAIGQSLPGDETFSATPDHPAVAYATAPSNDAVVRLALELDSGTRRLDFEPGPGYLRSVLRALDIRESSQVATFSKTSLQSPAISPANPRAIYFNDTTAVAAPPDGFIELASQDARQGLAFYVLEQRAVERPRFVRPSSCLGCHLSHATLYVPGVLARSIATGPGGLTLPHIWNGTTSHRTPHAERWAGWYVTGTLRPGRSPGQHPVASRCRCRRAARAVGVAVAGRPRRRRADVDAAQ